MNGEHGDKVYEFQKAVNTLIEKALLNINTMMIVKVLEFDAATQTVSVQPVIMGKERDETSEAFTYNRLGENIPYVDVELPPLRGVPVCHPRSGNFMVTLPVQVGDTGMLIISQRDISLWKQLGGTQPQGEVSVFDINDGVFLPFVPNAMNKISNYNSNALELRAGNDKMTMDGSGKITTNCDIVVNGISVVNHVHKVTVPSTPYSGNSDKPS